MALSIKSGDADRLARELALETGETLTEAIVVALRERLERRRASKDAQGDRLRRLQAEVALLPVTDARRAEEIIGYGPDGLPG